MKKRKYLTGSEVDKILQATKENKYGIRDYCLFQMSFLHGLRVSEAANLKLTDIDLVDRSIFIHRLKNSLSTQHPLLEEEITSLQKWIAFREQWRGANQGK